MIAFGNFYLCIIIAFYLEKYINIVSKRIQLWKEGQAHEEEFKAWVMKHADRLRTKDQFTMQAFEVKQVINLNASFILASTSASKLIKK